MCISIHLSIYSFYYIFASVLWYQHSFNDMIMECMLNRYESHAQNLYYSIYSAPTLSNPPSTMLNNNIEIHLLSL